MVFHSEKIFWDLFLLTYLTWFATTEYKFKTFQYNTYVTCLISRKFCNLFIIFSKPCYLSFKCGSTSFLTFRRYLCNIATWRCFCFCLMLYFRRYTREVVKFFNLHGWWFQSILFKLGKLPANLASACVLTHSITRSEWVNNINSNRYYYIFIIINNIMLRRITG